MLDNSRNNRIVGVVYFVVHALILPKTPKVIEILTRIV